MLKQWPWHLVLIAFIFNQNPSFFFPFYLSCFSAYWLKRADSQVSKDGCLGCTLWSWSWSGKGGLPALKRSTFCRLGGMCFKATFLRWVSVWSIYLEQRKSNGCSVHQQEPPELPCWALWTKPMLEGKRRSSSNFLTYSLTKTNSSGERTEGSPAGRIFSFSRMWGKNFSICEDK